MGCMATFLLQRIFLEVNFTRSIHAWKSNVGFCKEISRRALLWNVKKQVNGGKAEKYLHIRDRESKNFPTFLSRLRHCSISRENGISEGLVLHVFDAKVVVRVSAHDFDKSELLTNWRDFEMIVVLLMATTTSWNARIFSSIVSTVQLRFQAAKIFSLFLHSSRPTLDSCTKPTQVTCGRRAEAVRPQVHRVSFCAHWDSAQQAVICQRCVFSRHIVTRTWKVLLSKCTPTTQAKRYQNAWCRAGVLDGRLAWSFEGRQWNSCLFFRTVGQNVELWSIIIMLYWPPEWNLSVQLILITRAQGHFIVHPHATSRSTGGLSDRWTTETSIVVRSLCRFFLPVFRSSFGSGYFNFVLLTNMHLRWHPALSQLIEEQYGKRNLCRFVRKNTATRNRWVFLWSFFLHKTVISYLLDFIKNKQFVLQLETDILSGIDGVCKSPLLTLLEKNYSVAEMIEYCKGTKYTGSTTDGWYAQMMVTC